MKYKSLREYLKAISCPDLLQELIDTYNLYQTQGFIGECALRRIEKNFIQQLTDDSLHIPPTTFFKEIVLESYRLLYTWEKKKHEELRERIQTTLDNY